MRLHATKHRHCFLDVFDADGVRLENVITVNTVTGRATLAPTSDYDGLRQDYGRITEKIRHYRAPLRVYDTRLNMEITSQLQIEFLERSGAAARAAHHRWCMNNLRADLAFDELAWKYDCKLGTPTFKDVPRGLEAMVRTEVLRGLATQAEVCA